MTGTSPGSGPASPRWPSWPPRWSSRRRSMDNSNGEQAYDLNCISCGAACRAIDRFCSQCGRPDPTGREDALLSKLTLISSIEEVWPSGSEQQATLVKKERQHTSALQQLLTPGSMFGRRYRIQRFLGAGAMGYVCSAV